MYRFVTRLRNKLYDQGYLKSFDSELPVFCIGNVTAGGNGKTPLVCYLVSFLKSCGRNPVVLSRGYGGTEKGPYLLKENDSAQKVGDEPRMMSDTLNVPIVIARRRVDGAQYIAKNQLGDVIVLDDGYQHRALHRDCNIVVAHVGTSASVESFLGGKVLPFGRFREDRGEALQRADAVVFAHRKPKELSTLDDRLPSILPKGLPYYQSFVQSAGVYDSEGMRVEPREAFLFCAIASPEVVEDTLRQEGFHVFGHQFFHDHASYSESKMEQILSAAGDALPVCTEKDFVKLPSQFKSQVAVLRTKTYLEDEDAFAHQVQGVLLGETTQAE